MDDLFGPEQATRWIAVPGVDDDKYARGVVGFVTGSSQYPGAAVLGVEAAAHAGVGMIRYLGPGRPTRLVLQRRTEAVTADLLPTDLGAGVGGSKSGDLVISLPLREAREIFERDYLMAQINRFGGNISRTAAFIGMERSALHRKLKSLGVGSAQSFPN